MDHDKFNTLDGLVSEVDSQGPPTPEQQEQQAQEQRQAEAAIAAEEEAKEWGMIAYMVGGGLSMIAPELQQIYTEDKCIGWGRTVVPVSQKYGWSGPGSIPELGLALSTLGLAVPTYLVVKTKLAELKAVREAAEQADRRGDQVSPLAGVQSGAPDGS